MIIFESGNLFESRYQSLGVTVNSVGAMGKGIALDCKNRFPKVYEFYKWACQHGHFWKNPLLACAIPDIPRETQQVVCIKTKDHWRDDSTLELVRHSLIELTHQYDNLRITSLAIPVLGCGNGNLNAYTVVPMMVDYLDPLPIKIGLFLPDWYQR